MMRLCAFPSAALYLFQDLYFDVVRLKMVSRLHVKNRITAFNLLVTQFIVKLILPSIKSKVVPKELYLFSSQKKRKWRQKEGPC